MRAREDGGLAALRVLLRTTHLAGPDDLPSLVQAAGAALGAVAPCGLRSSTGPIGSAF